MHPRLRFAAALLLASLPALAADPTPFDAAVALFKARKLSEAQAAFEKLAAADPKNAEVQFYLGGIALNRGDTDRAIAYDLKATELAPNNAKYHASLGDVYGSAAQKASVFSQMGLAKKCKAEYDRAVELEPTNVDYHYSVFEYCRQAPSIVGGGTDRAEAEAAKIKQLDSLRGRQAYAALYIGQKKYDLALAQFDEVLKTEPDNYVALYQVGRLAAISGQYIDRGLKSLQRCLELEQLQGAPSHANVQWRIGNVLEKKNDLAGARTAYEAALKLDPALKSAIDSLKKLNDAAGKKNP